MELKNNLKIWEEVEKTNPRFTKESNHGGRKMTSINPTYQIKTATAVFGMYGKGFGLENLKHEYKEAGTTTLLVLNCYFFYFLEDKKYSFELSGAIKMVYISSKGSQIIDEDAYKKIETDLTTKALSKLGFNSDIFMGKFDDVKYMQDIIQEFKNTEINEIKAKINSCNVVEELHFLYNNYISFFSENMFMMDFLTARKNKILESDKND